MGRTRVNFPLPGTNEKRGAPGVTLTHAGLRREVVGSCLRAEDPAEAKLTPLRLLSFVCPPASVRSEAWPRDWTGVRQEGRRRLRHRCCSRGIRPGAGTGQEQRRQRGRSGCGR